MAAGRVQEVELATMSLECEFTPSNSPVAQRRLSCQISANQNEAETSANVNKHWKTRAKGKKEKENIIRHNDEIR